MQTLIAIAQDTSRPELERQVAKMMYEGFAWDCIEEKLKTKVVYFYTAKLTRETAGGSSLPLD